MRTPSAPERTVTAWLRWTRSGSAPARRSAIDPALLRTPLLRRVRTVLVVLLVVMVLGIAALAFVASFDAIRAYAVGHARIPAGRGWIPPLLVDTFILAGTLLWLGLSGRPPWRCGAAYFGRLLVTLGTTASVIVNVTQAPEGLAAWIVVGSPPIAQLLAIEALMLVVRFVLVDLAHTQAQAHPDATGSALDAHPAAAHPAAHTTAQATALRLDTHPAAHTGAQRTGTPLPARTAPAALRPGAGASALPAAPSAPAVRTGASARALTAPADTPDQPQRAPDPRTDPADTNRDAHGQARIRARVEAAWRDRELASGQQLVATQLAAELGAKPRHVQAVLRALRAGRQQKGQLP